MTSPGGRAFPHASPGARGPISGGTGRETAMRTLRHMAARAAEICRLSRFDPGTRDLRPWGRLPPRAMLEPDPVGVAAQNRAWPPDPRDRGEEAPTGPSRWWSGTCTDTGPHGAPDRRARTPEVNRGGHDEHAPTTRSGQFAPDIDRPHPRRCRARGFGATELDLRVARVVVRADVDRLHRTPQPESPSRPGGRTRHERHSLLSSHRGGASRPRRL